MCFGHLRRLCNFRSTQVSTKPNLNCFLGVCLDIFGYFWACWFCCLVVPLDMFVSQAYEWRQPLVLSENGCINLLPCEEGPCPMDLPRWARQLVLAHTCWQVKDEVAARSWAEEGSHEVVSELVANVLAEIFPDFDFAGNV